MKLAALLTCFNRKEKTLACISGLIDNVLVDSTLEIYLVDDGSTDGTATAVRELYPDVIIVTGTGSLFWNGGMRLAWSEAIMKDYDFYLWINDDSFIYSTAISNLLDTYESLVEKGELVGTILGSMVDPITQKLTYGGRLKGTGLNPLKMGGLLEPKSFPIKCDFVNGNLTLIPKKTVQTIGLLSERFTHSMGDFDYGLRAANAGFTCWVAPGVYGECEVNPTEGSWKDESLDINIRVKKMHTISQLPPVNEWQYFVKQHGGKLWPILYLSAWLRGRFPKLWLILNR